MCRTSAVYRALPFGNELRLNALSNPDEPTRLRVPCWSATRHMFRKKPAWGKPEVICDGSLLVRLPFGAVVALTLQGRGIQIAWLGDCLPQILPFLGDAFARDIRLASAPEWRGRAQQKNAHEAEM